MRIRHDLSGHHSLFFCLHSRAVSERVRKSLHGPRSPKSGKEGFGVKKLPFPSAPEKGDLESKIPIFLVEPCIEMGIF